MPNTQVDPGVAPCVGEREAPIGPNGRASGAGGAPDYFSARPSIGELEVLLLRTREDVAVSLDHLFRPLALGPAELPCRIVSTSHQTTLVHDHLPTDDFVAYHRARAAGGTGLIVMEAVAVAPSGLLTAHTIGGYLDGMVAGYERVAAA